MFVHPKHFDRYDMIAAEYDRFFDEQEEAVARQADDLLDEYDELIYAAIERLNKYSDWYIIGDANHPEVYYLYNRGQDADAAMHQLNEDGCCPYWAKPKELSQLGILVFVNEPGSIFTIWEYTWNR